jgi:hypothetical protein
MSRTLIQHYLNDLATLRQVRGTHRESVVREAFTVIDLLQRVTRVSVETQRIVDAMRDVPRQ